MSATWKLLKPAWPDRLTARLVELKPTVCFHGPLKHQSISPLMQRRFSLARSKSQGVWLAGRG